MSHCRSLYRHTRVIWLTLIVAVSVTACASQPQPPAVALPAPASWSAVTTQAAASAPIEHAWWTQLNDHAVNMLTTAALTDNPTLAQAMGRVDEANANLGVRTAQRLPALQASLGASRGKSADGGDMTYGSVASAGLALSWEIDLFGRVRATIDSAQYRLDARHADAEAARLSLTARVADTVLALRGCRFSQAVLRDDIESRALTLKLTQSKLQAGAIAAVDAARARASLAGARTTLALRQQECTGHLNALVMLTGLDVASIAALMEVQVSANSSASMPRYAEWVMPSAPKYRIAVPAAVLAKHPAVRAAEAELSAAWSEINTARAERLPRLDLGAALSGQWIRAGTQGASAWSIGPGLSMPLFDGGRGAAVVLASEARYRQALATLRLAVRTATQDVENALAASLSAGMRLDTTRDAVDAAQSVFDTSNAMWRGGATSLFVLEDARRVLASAQNDAIAAVQDSSQAWIALVLACGNSSIISESSQYENL